MNLKIAISRFGLDSRKLVNKAANGASVFAVHNFLSFVPLMFLGGAMIQMMTYCMRQIVNNIMIILSIRKVVYEFVLSLNMTALLRAVLLGTVSLTQSIE